MILLFYLLAISDFMNLINSKFSCIYDDDFMLTYHDDFT